MGFSRPALHLVPVTVPLFRYLVCDAHHIRKGGGRRALRACPCPRLFNSNPRRGSECDAATRSYPLRSMRKGPPCQRNLRAGRAKCVAYASARADANRNGRVRLGSALGSERGSNLCHHRGRCVTEVTDNRTLEE